MEEVADNGDYKRVPRAVLVSAHKSNDVPMPDYGVPMPEDGYQVPTAPSYHEPMPTAPTYQKPMPQDTQTHKVHQQPKEKPKPQQKFLSYDLQQAGWEIVKDESGQQEFYQNKFTHKISFNTPQQSTIHDWIVYFQQRPFLCFCVVCGFFILFYSVHSLLKTKDLSN